ncbi:MAG TPA: hypothetical protein VFJ15_14435 [Oleiagrimonas sp.]|nr:hypothetical protein [Oleiagrimonas sp.]
MLKFPRTGLGIYALIVTVAFAAVVTMGARADRDADFDTINVERINVREPDGTLRMVISNRSRFPGLILHGKEYSHQRPRAGMIFYNDEGTEQGGLIFSGRKTSDGGYASGLSLTFDRYQQDQQLQLIGIDKDGHYFAGLRVRDVPHRPILQDIKEREKLAAMSKSERDAVVDKRNKENYYGARRFFAGKSRSGNSVVMLRDANGKPRLAMRVTPQGEASIVFLDAKGNVQRKLTADELAQHAR